MVVLEGKIFALLPCAVFNPEQVRSKEKKKQLQEVSLKKKDGINLTGNKHDYIFANHKFLKPITRRQNFRQAQIESLQTTLLNLMKIAESSLNG